MAVPRNRLADMFAAQGADEEEADAFGEQLPPGVGDLEGSPALTDESLATLAEQVGDVGADASEVTDPADLEALLADPNLDPTMRQELQSQLALAARRQLAGGMGGAGGLV